MGNGERMTSPPRTLNSHAMEAGAVSTAASAPARARVSPIRARLALESSPEYSAAWGTTGAAGCGGRALQDHRGPGRAGEAGGPGQPVVGGGQILVLVLVLVGDEEAVQPLAGHGLADQRHMPGPEGAVGGFVKRLAHARDVSGSSA